MGKQLPAGYEPALTSAEVGRVFGVDPKTVTRWAQAGVLPCFFTPGGHRRYWDKDVRALLAAHQVSGAAL
jgi:predicted site-specific integrase-resolvase